MFYICFIYVLCLFYICLSQLFQYWWKLVLVGIYSFEWYVMNDENGNSLALHMQEGMENWVGLLKQLTTAKIKGSAGWLLRLKNFIDLYVLGGLRENIVDFRVTKRKSICEQHLIWQEGVTDQLLFEEERQLPARCRDYLVKIDKIEFGDRSTIDFSLFISNMSTAEEQRNMNIMSEDIDEQVDAAIIHSNSNDDSVIYEVRNQRTNVSLNESQDVSRVMSRSEFLTEAANASRLIFNSEILSTLPDSDIVSN